jgi:hypothetical protein
MRRRSSKTWSRPLSKVGLPYMVRLQGEKECGRPKSVLIEGRKWHHLKIDTGSGKPVFNVNGNNLSANRFNAKKRSAKSLFPMPGRLRQALQSVLLVNLNQRSAPFGICSAGPNRPEDFVIAILNTA